MSSNVRTASINRFLLADDLRSQLVQHAKSLFESSSINDQLTHQIQETLQSLTADANNLALFAGFPLSRRDRFDRTGFAQSSAAATSVVIGILLVNVAYRWHLAPVVSLPPERP